MTSETPNLHVLKNLNISKTEKDIEKPRTPLRLVWKCYSDAFQIGSTIFRRRGTLTCGYHFKNENRMLMCGLTFSYKSIIRIKCCSSLWFS